MLTGLLVRELRVPVIAAGGLMDGGDVAAVLRLGAAAAQLGTAFIDCAESAAEPAHRDALRGQVGRNTVVTRAISGRPARCVANRFTALGEGVSNDAIPAYPVAYDAGKAVHAAAKARGEFGYGAHWAGQGAPRARAMPAAELVERIAAEIAAAR